MPASQWPTRAWVLSACGWLELDLRHQATCMPPDPDRIPHIYMLSIAEQRHARLRPIRRAGGLADFMQAIANFFGASAGAALRMGKLPGAQL